MKFISDYYNIMRHWINCKNLKNTETWHMLLGWWFIMADYPHEGYMPERGVSPLGIFLMELNCIYSRFAEKYTKLRTIISTGAIGLEASTSHQTVLIAEPLGHWWKHDIYKIIKNYHKSLKNIFFRLSK